MRGWAGATGRASAWQGVLAQRLSLGAWLLVGLLLLCLLRGLVLAHLVRQGGLGLHVDEAQYWQWSQSLAAGYYSKPPMIALLIAASTALFGDGVLGIKALTLACWPAAAVVVYRLGREMASPVAAGWSAFLFATTPAAQLLGLFATTDAPLVLAWALAAWALWRTGQARPGDPTRWRAWLGLGLALGLGLLSKYTMLAFGLSLAGVLLERRRAGVPWPWAGLLLAMALAAALMLPNLAWNARHGWATWLHTADITVAAPATGTHLLSVLSFAAGQALMLGPVLAAWALRGGLQRLARRAGWRADPSALAGAGHAEAHRFALWCAVPLLLLGCAVAWQTQAQINWAAPALIGLCLAAGLAMAGPMAAQARPWLLASGLISAVLSLAIVLAGSLAAWLRLDWPDSLDALARMRGWQPAFEALAGRDPSGGPQAGDLVLGGSRVLIVQGAHAWRQRGLQWSALPPPGRPKHHYEMLALEAGAMKPLPAQRRWFLSASAPTAAQRRLLGPMQLVSAVRHRVSDRRELQLMLWLLEAPP